MKTTESAQGRYCSGATKLKWAAQQKKNPKKILYRKEQQKKSQVDFVRNFFILFSFCSSLRHREILPTPPPTPLPWTLTNAKRLEVERGWKCAHQRKPRHKNCVLIDRSIECHTYSATRQCVNGATNTHKKCNNIARRHRRKRDRANRAQKMRPAWIKKRETKQKKTEAMIRTQAIRIDGEIRTQ